MTLLGRIFHTGCERTTSLGKAVAGLAAGAVTGAVLVSVPFILSGSPAAIVLFPIAFIAAFVVWAVGLALVGAPGWWVLHRLGARCQQAAMIYGGGLMTLVVLIGGAGSAIWRGRFADLVPMLPWYVWLVVTGVIVGWIVARIAYAQEPAV